MEHRIVNAVGVCFYSENTGRYLFLLRNDPKHPGSWGLPGGKVDPGENLLETLVRECQEELGSMPAYHKLVPLEKFTSSDHSFVYHTFWCSVEQEFIPVLNQEHNGYAWLNSGSWPRPMHPGLWNTLSLDAVQDKLRVIE
jgi:8-oxo-dGTP pyrophosphatase MutT (NUDIX family)